MPEFTFRRFTRSDAGRVLEIFGEAGHRMLEPATIDAAESWITNLPYDRYAITAEGKIVGEVHLDVAARNRSAELGYVTAKESERQGVATLAITHITAYGFDELGLHRIWARTSALNLGSIRALQKAGFHHEATLIESRLINGRYVNELIFRLLQSERVGV